MNLRHTGLLAFTAGLAALAATSLTFAASTDAPPPGGQPGRAAMARPASFAPGPGMPGAPGLLGEEQLARLKTELKISAAQEGAWQAFSAKLAEQAKQAQLQREQFLKSTPVVSTPERMAQHIEQMKQQLASLQAVQTAMKELYGQLSTEQRNILDHLGPGGMGGHPHLQGGGHPGGEHGGQRGDGRPRG